MRTPSWLAGLLMLASGGAAAGPAVIWETDGFNNPESVCADIDRDQLYVSNVAGVPVEKDGEGFISRLSPDGEVLERRWIDGLNAPKGMAVVGGQLFVSDIDRVVRIEIASGEIERFFEVPGARFLNDVTADAQGRVFVSDMMGNAIHRIQGERLDTLVAGEKLLSPNGLHAEPGRLVVGAWGQRTEGFATDRPGYLLTVDTQTGEVAPLAGRAPIGNLDGVVSDGDGGYFLTDWVAGRLLQADDTSDASTLIDLPQGSADLGRIPGDKTLLVPLMKDGVVRAYRVD